MASAAKRADRETTEGSRRDRRATSVGTIVAVGCETEPVSKNDEFLAFADDVLDAVFERGRRRRGARRACGRSCSPSSVRTSRSPEPAG